MLRQSRIPSGWEIETVEHVSDVGLFAWQERVSFDGDLPPACAAGAEIFGPSRRLESSDSNG